MSSRPLTDADLNAMSDDESTPVAASAASAPAAAAGNKKNKKKKKKAGGIGSSAAADADGDEPMDEAHEWLASLSEDDILNPKLLDPTFVESLRTTFHSGAPFKHLAIESLLDVAFLRNLEGELKTLEYYHKSNDLFEFAQSNDLKSVTTPLVSKLKSVLYSKKFRDTLTKITGIELVDLETSVDMSANVYGDTNTLLCHDDELLGRRIAYILYLVPPSWSATDGGTLDLFATDAHGQPSTIAKSLVPKWNTFTFFEVSPVSFHQVSEVLTSEEDEETGENKVRISISGWYHGAPIVRPAPYIEPPMTMTPLQPNANPASTLDEWLSPDYRKGKNIIKISQQFGEESSIDLVGFIKKEKYEALMRELNETKKWTKVGPANKRNFEKWQEDGSASSAVAASSSSSSSSSLISSLHSFLQSRDFSEFLTSITGMTYLSSHGTVRKFTPGSYTLAHSEDNERFEEGVDIALCCLLPVPAGVAGKKALKWNAEEMGGTVHYIEEGAEEELMSVEPQPNTLSIIYRSGIMDPAERKEAEKNGTGGVIKFVKYVNHRANQPRFDFDYVFRVEAGEGEEDEEEEEEVEQKQPTKGKKK